MDPDGANSLYKLLYKIHKEYGTTIVVVEHRIDYLLPYMTDLVVLKKGRLVAADKFENAARVMYKDEPCGILCRRCGALSWGLKKNSA